MLAKITRKAPAPEVGFDPARIRASVENSLKALKRERVEGLLLHEVSANDVNDDLIRTLQELRQAGKALSFGLATNPGDTRAILERYPLAFDVVQIPASAAGAIEQIGANLTLILHSVLGHRLETLVQSDPATATRFAAETGVELSNREAAAQLLLGAAMTQNPDGITLFSSSRPETVRRNAALAPLDTETAAQLIALLGE
jgi:aryl-alcohol dehydrogenase-like predicted oxidoreductase